MDKAQAIDRFWNSFGLPAYDENSVPDDAKMPYITYSLTVDNLDSPVTLSGSLWYRSESWREITLKSEEISKKVSEKGFYSAKLDKGYVWITRGSPFAQRMTDTDPIKRIYINLMAEFLTAY
jgi:hypothetical protein